MSEKATGDEQLSNSGRNEERQRVTMSESER